MKASRKPGEREITLGVNLDIAEKIYRLLCSELTDTIAGVCLEKNHISEVTTLSEFAEDLDGCIGGMKDEIETEDRILKEAMAKAVVTEDNPLGIPIF